MEVKRKIPPPHPFRLGAVMAVMAACAGALVWRAADLQVLDRGFLQRQGDARYLRDVEVPAHRGMILDRNGEPLAVSTPVVAVWANPKEMLGARRGWSDLGHLLHESSRALEDRLNRYAQREFVYLKRSVPPDVAEKVGALQVPGVYLQREYHRYYPTGEVSSHIVGFTNVDDHGQEGIELSYDDTLRGQVGLRRVLKDRIGRVVEEVESIREPEPGQDMRLSIDRRIQYLAYRELKTAVRLRHARAGSAVVLDARTGEVLAMVNQPSFNPNDRSSLRSDRFRNRSVTDTFEPGSTMKPFTVAAALESGEYFPSTEIDTAPGYFRVKGLMIRDARNYGQIDIATIIEKSSNVGVSKIALSMPQETLWRMYDRVGFGVSSQCGLSGEASGQLPFFSDWHESERATLSFGYGLSLTAMQLARAYGLFADHGRIRPVSLFRTDSQTRFEQVISPRTAREVLAMMESVISSQGTGRRAKVHGYRVAGKTGTVRKIIDGQYSDEHYLSLFAGVAPVSDPRLVMVIVVDEPSVGGFYGGEVAAPVFSRVMSGALWMMGIPPDDLTDHRQTKVSGVGV